LSAERREPFLIDAEISGRYDYHGLCGPLQPAIPKSVLDAPVSRDALTRDSGRSRRYTIALRKLKLTLLSFNLTLFLRCAPRQQVA